MSTPRSAYLPPDHPLRFPLSEEAHARTPGPLQTPCRMVLMAFTGDATSRSKEFAHLEALAQRYGLPCPPADANHCVLNCGEFSLTYEKHSEFSRLLVSVPYSAPETPFAHNALAVVPSDWLQTLPGELIAAMEVAFVEACPPDEIESMARHFFQDNTVVGAVIGSGAAVALTDFRVGPTGFSRMLLLNRGLGARQAGRTVQRLFELDVYRMMALLALPVARELKPRLTALEQELAEISTALSKSTSEEEVQLFERLTRLEAEIEATTTKTQYRFNAAVAYDALVHARIEELREERLPGLQTFREFIDRRFAPAMATCQVTAVRQSQISERVARVTQLLTTRVDLSREQQNQVLLESMNRRAGIQLRMQQAVEGFSVAAITYYGTGLLGYFVKAIHSFGLAFKPDLVMASSVPLIAVLAYAAVHRVKKRLRPPN